MKSYWFLGILLLRLLPDSATVLVAQKRPSPNVLMICVDDLNDYIGEMGHPDAITPNMNRLIKRGVLFTNAHCQSPLCGPSRAAIMTGLRPSTTGIYGLLKDEAVKPSNEATRNNTFLHQYFKDQGYYTMGIGKIFHESTPDGLLSENGGREKGIVGPFPPKKINYQMGGTDSDWGAYPEKDEQMPDYRTAQWAIERLNRKYDTPFFLTVGFFRPHVPWHVPQKWFDLYNPDKLHKPPYAPSDMADLPAIAMQIESAFMPSTEWAIANNQWGKALQGYLASISFVDHYIGEVLKALEASPYADNTLIVLWSDHGYRMGEKNRFAKQHLWERATKVPLVFAGPGIPKNKRVSAPVELFSVYPTLTDLCGLPSNSNLEARSIHPLLKNAGAAWEHPAITTWGRNNHGIRSKEYHYIRYEDGSEELYVMKDDPNEWKNVASEPKYARVKETLKQFLPQVNAPWSPGNSYDGVEYFKKQRLADSK